jgi:3-keto-5-aminohexanoate cleavage enzyme
MQKLVITAACDSTSAFPGNPYNPTPKGSDEVIKESIRCIDAGAAVSHIHGPRVLDAEQQPDGSRLSNLDIPGWGYMRDGIVSQRNTIMQYGIASGRFPQRKELMRRFPTDMISVCFTSHDECFDYDSKLVPKEVYGLHPRTELDEYCTFCNDLNIRIEVEAFTTGAFWNAQRVVNKGLMKTPGFTTLFFGWRGGAWTPPTTDAVLYMKRYVPKDFVWSSSVMDPDSAWNVLATVVTEGGHVRVGMEDNPFVRPGEYARSSAELIEKMVRIARELGREVASPDEAKDIFNLPKRNWRLGEVKQ